MDEKSRTELDNNAACEIADKLFGDSPEFAAETSVLIVKHTLKRLDEERSRHNDQAKRFAEIIEGIMKNVKEI